jgi:hypothetical protein
MTQTNRPSQFAPTKKSKADRVRAQREFESKMFLVFALRSLYRHYVRPPMIKNWIAKLDREIKTERKGNRKRGRGPLIRFGKKVIDALLHKKNQLASELWEDYTDDASHLVRATTRAYGVNQYGYAERRAKEALKRAENAFQRNRPTEKMPFMQNVNYAPDEADMDEYILHDPEQVEYKDTHESDDTPTGWDNPFRRPSEEGLNAMLANACDDNGYSTDKLDKKWKSTPVPTPSNPPEPEDITREEREMYEAEIKARAKRKAAAQKRRESLQDKQIWDEQKRIAQLLRNNCNDDFEEEGAIQDPATKSSGGTRKPRKITSQKKYIQTNLPGFEHTRS